MVLSVFEKDFESVSTYFSNRYCKFSFLKFQICGMPVSRLPTVGFESREIVSFLEIKRKVVKLLKPSIYSQANGAPETLPIENLYGGLQLVPACGLLLLNTLNFK